MPPSASADNGGFAWFITIRPRDYTDELEQAVITYITEKLKPDWHLGVREKGNHSHWTIFTNKGIQRSNLITQFLNNPLKGYTDDEKKLFRTYNRESKTGAVLNCTTLGVVAEYLSGEFDKKLDDDFEVISENLPAPEDISELEEYLPAVDGLKRKRQISVWYALQAQEYKERDMPKLVTEETVLSFLNHRMYVWKDMDILADQKKLKEKVRCLVRYMNEDGSATYNDRQLLDEDDMLHAKKSMKYDTNRTDQNLILWKDGPWMKHKS